MSISNSKSTGSELQSPIEYDREYDADRFQSNAYSPGDFVSTGSVISGEGDRAGVSSALVGDAVNNGISLEPSTSVGADVSTALGIISGEGDRAGVSSALVGDAVNSGISLEPSTSVGADVSRALGTPLGEDVGDEVGDELGDMVSREGMPLDPSVAADDGAGVTGISSKRRNTL